MGQSVSVDEEPFELKEVLGLGQQSSQEKPLSASSLEAVGGKHHIKVWRFEKAGRSIADSAVPLCGDRAAFCAELVPSCSYLILHVHSAGSEESQVGASDAVLDELAAHASATCTPRGLSSEVISQHLEGASALPSGTGGCRWSGTVFGQRQGAAAAERPAPRLRYDLFVWHGLQVDPTIKARAFAKAFELDRLLRLGLLLQRPLADSIMRALPLRGGAHRHQASSGREHAANGTALWSQNRLLSLIHGGSGSRRPSGSQRFPRVGQSICRSLGRAPGRTGPLITSRTGRPPPMMDVDTPADNVEVDATGRKRLRGSEPGRTTLSRGLPAAPATARGSVDSAEPPNLPALNLAGLRERETGVMPAECAKPNSGRRFEPPAMLNLEEIDMSEEELKHLQLKQYRQECSEVIEKTLFISSYQVACTRETLRSHQITHIVNTAADVCDNHFEGDIEYLTYYLKDTNHEEISALFYRTLSWIHEAIQKQGRVLVHCREGVSRSATMVIAYLMWRFMMPFEAAHDAIRKVRPICNPNTGFTCQLLRFGKKLGVGLSGQVSPAGSAEGLVVSRVVVHNAKAPFLVLSTVDWGHDLPPGARGFDPRFGWVVQRGTQMVLWLGSLLLQPEEVEAVINQHVAWAETFERCRYALSVVHEGREPPSFWTMADVSPSKGQYAFSFERPCLDADADVLRALAERRGEHNTLEGFSAA